MLDMTIELAEVGDAKDILDLQKLAYMSEAVIYDDFTIPPLTQTPGQIKSDFENELFLKASINGNIIGSVRAHMRQDTCYIGRLIIHPSFQNRGIGTELMNEIERLFINAKKFELFTGHRSDRNIHLYRNLGYATSRHEVISENLTLIYMEKQASPHRS